MNPNDKVFWKKLIDLRQRNLSYRELIDYVSKRGINHLSFRELISLNDSIADNDPDLATRAVAQVITTLFNKVRLCDTLMKAENFPQKEAILKIGVQQLYGKAETYGLRFGNTFTNQTWRIHKLVDELNNPLVEVIWWNVLERLQSLSPFMNLWEEIRNHDPEMSNGSIWRSTQPYNGRMINFDKRAQAKKNTR